MKKKPPFNANMAIRGSIRRVFARSPIVIEVRDAGKRKVPWFKKDGTRAKVDRNEYHCQICLNWVMGSIAVDHIDPVISTETGFVDWNTFVDRMGFDRKENLQRVCKECHQKKTNAERFERNFKNDLELITSLELSNKLDVVKAGIKKFTKKKLSSNPYPPEFIERVEKLRAWTKKK